MIALSGGRHVVLIALALGMAGCERDPGGPLAPAATADARQASDDVVVLRNGELSARVAARWAADGAQSMRIMYRNDGKTAAKIALAGLKLMRGADEAVLRTAVDATGVDLADARSDNDRGKVLYSLDGAGPADAVLALAPGSARELDLGFTSFGDTVTAATGDKIVAMVPLGGAPVAVALVAKRPPF